MKYLSIISWVFVLTIYGCSRTSPSNLKSDKAEIKSLIKEVLTWSESKEAIELLPVIINQNDSSIIGFDLNKLKYNLEKLKGTNFFAKEFIDNYNQIIINLDKNLRSGVYEKWHIGELPTFKFANDYDPWWAGQERFSIECGAVEMVAPDKNEDEFDFICGRKGEECLGMENYKMRFRVVKENNKWKISYMEGFDFREGIKKDGEL